MQPIWTPDGKRVVFSKVTGGVRTPFWVPADGSGEPEPLFKGDHRFHNWFGYRVSYRRVLEIQAGCWRGW